MKLLLAFFLVIGVVHAGAAEWKSRASLIIIHTAYTSLADVDAFGKEVMTSEFKKRALADMPATARIRYDSHVSCIDIIVSSSTRDVSLAANRAIMEAIVTLAKKSKPRFEIVLNEPRISDPQ